MIIGGRIKNNNGKRSVQNLLRIRMVIILRFLSQYLTSLLFLLGMLLQIIQLPRKSHHQHGIIIIIIINKVGRHILLLLPLQRILTNPTRQQQQQQHILLLLPLHRILTNRTLQQQQVIGEHIRCVHRKNHLGQVFLFLQLKLQLGWRSQRIQHHKLNLLSHVVHGLPKYSRHHQHHRTNLKLINLDGSPKLLPNTVMYD
mmetsp:Transcript_26722/g.25575  ORF Transcript_26722/g.25575 Transcript_26722/m.25575 type:complete len:200 (-) Transcript_26722:52-651(-)